MEVEEFLSIIEKHSFYALICERNRTWQKIIIFLVLLLMLFDGF